MWRIGLPIVALLVTPARDSAGVRQPAGGTLVQPDRCGTAVRDLHEHAEYRAGLRRSRSRLSFSIGVWVVHASVLRS